MKQSPKKSLIESIVQTVIGLGASVILEYLMGIPVSFGQNFIIVSIIRGYIVRRIFEKL